MAQYARSPSEGTTPSSTDNALPKDLLRAYLTTTSASHPGLLISRMRGPIWHSPAVILLATPKWATHWFHITGRKMIDREVMDEKENVFVAIPASIAGGILYTMGAGEFLSYGIGFIVRDLARLAKLEAFRKIEMAAQT